jgi:hypothetical protein
MLTWLKGTRQGQHPNGRHPFEWRHNSPLSFLQIDHSIRPPHLMTRTHHSADPGHNHTTKRTMICRVHAFERGARRHLQKKVSHLPTRLLTYIPLPHPCSRQYAWHSRVLQPSSPCRSPLVGSWLRKPVLDYADGSWHPC